MCSLKRKKGNGSWNWCEHMAPQIIWASRCEPEMRALTPPAICFRHLHFPHLSYHPIYFQWLGQIKNHPISNIDIFSKYLKLNCPIYNFQKKKKNIWKQEEKQYWGRIVHISGSFQRLFVQIWRCLSNCSPTLAVCWLTCRYFLRQTFTSREVGAGLPPLNCVLMEHLSCQGAFSQVREYSAFTRVGGQMTTTVMHCRVHVRQHQTFYTFPNIP